MSVAHSAPDSDLEPGAPRHDLLRLATAGSVDDGKSTLVGRLLHDTKSVLADQLAAVERVSRDRGLDTTDLALLTDGLRAEREQGITIDVAYRYFSTATRSYVLADTPGHVQYTRNMVTGASTAELALILIDARHGVVEQTRRHLAVTGLLGVRHVALAVNKMDLVDWDQAVFDRHVAEFVRLAEGFGIVDVQAVPLSALFGDNIVDRSDRASWYAGPTLLEYLESVPVGSDPAEQPLRMPVQYVIRPQSAEHRDYRGYAGRLASGVVHVGDEVVVLPAGFRTRVVGIDRSATPGEPGRPDEHDVAFAPQSVVLRLADQLDISRGDLIAVGRAPAAGGPGDHRHAGDPGRAAAAGQGPRPGAARHPQRPRPRRGARRRARRHDPAAGAGAGRVAAQRDRSGPGPARRAGAARRLRRPATHRCASCSWTRRTAPPWPRAWPSSNRRTG